MEAEGIVPSGLFSVNGRTQPNNHLSVRSTQEIIMNEWYGSAPVSRTNSDENLLKLSPKGTSSSGTSSSVAHMV